jgi:hypothetical protein
MRDSTVYLTGDDIVRPLYVEADSSWQQYPLLERKREKLSLWVISGCKVNGGVNECVL